MPFVVFLRLLGEDRASCKTRCIHFESKGKVGVRKDEDVWNMAGLLVRPKYMMRGLNSPQFVWKAAFHLSPSWIQTLL